MPDEDEARPHHAGPPAGFVGGGFEPLTTELGETQTGDSLASLRTLDLFGDTADFSGTDLSSESVGNARVPHGPLGGRYRPEEPLGSGGNGAVYRALDLVTERAVAVKLLPKGPGSCIETELLRQVQQPGVVELLDHGPHPQGHYLVMALVEGRPFPGRPPAEPAPGSPVRSVPNLAVGPLPTPTRRPWRALRGPALQLLRLLARLHRSGVCHLDLKPENVLIGAQGGVTLLDFGMARGGGGGGRPHWGIDGTPRYSAPEQLSERPTGPFTDVYAVGLMLYEALAGELPHSAETPRQMLERRLSLPAAPLRSGPPALGALVLELLEREPSARPSAAEAAARLAGIDTTEELPRLLRSTSPAQLFSDPEPFHHIPERAWQQLGLRAGSDPVRQLAELSQWVEAGLALRAPDGRVSLLPGTLELLEEGADVRPLRSLEHTLDRRAHTLLQWIDACQPLADEDTLRRITGSSPAAWNTALAPLLRAELVRRHSWQGRCWLRCQACPGTDPTIRESARRARALALPLEHPARAAWLARLPAHTPRALAQELLQCAEALHEAGEHRRALRALHQAGLSGPAGPLAAAPSTLQLRGRIALALNIVADLRDAAWRIRQQADPEDALASWCGEEGPLGSLVQTLQAAAAIATDAPSRALSLLRRVPERSLSPALERRAWELRLAAAAMLDDDDEQLELLELAGLVGLDDDPELRRSVPRSAWQRAYAGWLGTRRHRLGEAEEAARLYGLAIHEDDPLDTRLDRGVDRALTLLEAGQLDEAARTARRARRLAARSHRPLAEALARWVERSVLARRDRFESHPMELEAASTLGPAVEAMYAQLEAAGRWRAGQPEAGLHARRAVRAFHRAGLRDNALLAEVLSLAPAAPLTPGECWPLVRRARRLGARHPARAAQALTLLARFCEAPRPEWRAWAAEAVARCSGDHALRLEVLSLEECLLSA